MQILESGPMDSWKEKIVWKLRWVGSLQKSHGLDLYRSHMGFKDFKIREKPLKERQRSHHVIAKHWALIFPAWSSGSTYFKFVLWNEYNPTEEILLPLLLLPWLSSFHKRMSWEGRVPIKVCVGDKPTKPLRVQKDHYRRQNPD